MTVSDENDDMLNMDALDAMLNDTATGAIAHPSAAFMARVLEDALVHQPLPGSVPLSVWEQITNLVGGWQGMGGLVAATCAGFWIGINPPDGLPTQFDTFLNMETSVSLLDYDSEDTGLIGFGWDLEEG